VQAGERLQGAGLGGSLGRTYPLPHPPWVIHRGNQRLTYCPDSQTEEELSTSATYPPVHLLTESKLCHTSLVAGEWSPASRGHTMILGFGSFAIEIHLTALDIRAGSYDLLWDRNGLCICKGMKTLWANWE
jgi:hypothetical protein